MSFIVLRASTTGIKSKIKLIKKHTKQSVKKYKYVREVTWNCTVKSMTCYHPINLCAYNCGIINFLLSLWRERKKNRVFDLFVFAFVCKPCRRSAMKSGEKDGARDTAQAECEICFTIHKGCAFCVDCWPFMKYHIIINFYYYYGFIALNFNRIPPSPVHNYGFCM